MKKLLITSLVAVVASSAFAVPFYTSGALTANSATFDNPGGSSLGSGVHHYDLLPFTVTVAGNYTFEMASPNTLTAGSDALDTYIRIYQGSFDPLNPVGAIASNDDFTGALTVLPGPYAGTITANSTGFQTTQPGSRVANLALLTGTDYFLVMTSFRQTDYVHSPTGTEGNQIGNYFVGIDGPGEVNAVPEPATMVILGGAALAAAARRRKK